MILGDGTEVRMGNTYGQGEVGDERGSKEMDRCPLTVAVIAQDHVCDLNYHTCLICCTIDVVDWDRIHERMSGDIV
jgi:hypothetical protein